jgi:hypothetical protein
MSAFVRLHWRLLLLLLLIALVAFVAAVLPVILLDLAVQRG